MFEHIPSVLDLKEFLKKQTHRLKARLKSWDESPDYPRWHEILPYRFVDTATDLFLQEDSSGFGLEILPLSSANASIIDGLHDLFRLKLTKADVVQCLHIATNQIMPSILNGLTVQPSDQANTDHLRTMQAKFFEHATQFGFSNRLTMNTGIKDHRVFLFFSRRVPYTSANRQVVFDFRAKIQAELSAIQIMHEPMGVDRLRWVVNQLMQLSPDTIWPSDSRVKPHIPLNEQFETPGFELIESPESLQCIQQTDSGEQETIIQALSVKRYPDVFSLAQGADCYAPILERAKSIGCPFVISWHMRLLDQERMKSLSARRYRKSRKNLTAGLSQFFPSLGESTDEWDFIRTDLEQDKVSLVKLHYQVFLFSRKKEALMDLEAARGAFRSQDMVLMPCRYLQKNAFLSAFPFTGSSGFFDDFSLIHQSKTMTSFNAINFLPIIADARLSKRGLLLPSFRQQCCFFDLFDENLPITNFNMVVAGTSGSGKSFFVNSLLFDVFNMGGYVFVIDKGDSYKKLCHLLGGAYLSAEKLHLNPFTYVKDIQTESESIRDLLLVAISPDKDLEPMSQELLREAVVLAFKKTGQKTRIDDVVSALEVMHAMEAERLLKELIILLRRYTTQGDAPELFNCSSPIAPDQRFVVLELGGLLHMPKKLKAVTFALLQYIEARFRDLPRDTPKVLSAEEIAETISSDHSTEARYFQNKVRTTRKYYGAVIFVAQCLDDYAQSNTGRAIFANAAFKVIFSQEKDGMGQFLNWQASDSGETYFTPYTETVLRSFGQAYRQGFSDFLLLMKHHVSFHRFFADPFSKVLFSSHAKEFEAVKRLQEKGVPLVEAIIQVAKAHYPEETQRLFVTPPKQEANT